MNLLTPAGPTSWPQTALLIAVLVVGTFLIALIIVTLLEARKLKLGAAQTEELRQLVRRFEQLAENSNETQERMAADLAELRARTASIEQILRTVE
ncbi:Tfp pilus assembly protein PilO [Thermocatellispora tengchongensis]|uniref:Tfp pilus assembly protein PilO n=1 Tax=Thermocatellispora tengchongensis TaxID=1073253 RepID=A0A840NYS6_9ACTN|nr:hypothetical protein [Thermocatellispora tengchongensis]MBB5130811.1 Tfp pilus assembly protein PilO [Thermocatellispora tengchongensis]